ncbi:hexokinase type 2 [Drosophila sulfurigaster albostrigata]|uniref:hexokinase type 2 n=1 Tax=Drosophila sulfurigaster albostrigata TaxID=89887 RepID=UPI002D21ED7E|nr:hexokinase type 2 [Drosophila sulfurigaster albostrigata]
MDVELRELMQAFVLSDYQVQEVYSRFCLEIAKGLRRSTNSQSNTKCFPTYVQELPTGDEMGKYLALDLGGTNFRVLLVSLKGHHDATVESQIYAVPKDLMIGPGVELFDHIAECLAKFVQKHNMSSAYLPLGFTFSFPCVQAGLKEAMLTRWTKGFGCPGVEGEDVGRMLHEAIRRRGDADIAVVALLNDTTGTLMSCAHRNPECRVGVIVGTGCNACYVEHVDNVDLLDAQFKRKEKQIIVNCEWGAFGESGQLDFVRTEYDNEVDRKSINRAQQLFEKMTSGMYLGELVRLVLVRALERNAIFKGAGNRRAEYAAILQHNIDIFETKHISEIESDTFPELANTRRIIKQLFGIEKASVEDCQKLRYICECISSRAATLVAIGISGLINRIADRKVVVGIDGSVYRYHPKFDTYIRNTMQKLVKSDKEFDIMLSEDGSGRGAALVAAVASKTK